MDSTWSSHPFALAWGKRLALELEMEYPFPVAFDGGSLPLSCSSDRSDPTMLARTGQPEESCLSIASSCSFRRSNLDAVVFS